MVRRLPVVQNKAAADASAEARPRWQWVLIGAGLVFTIWMPLAMIALWIGRTLVSSVKPGPELASVLVLIPIICSFCVACVSGGAIVGRFGGHSGAREAALSGALAAFAAWLVALIAGALSPWAVAAASAVMLMTTAVALSWLGGRIGVRRRPS